MTQDILTTWQLDHDNNARMCRSCNFAIWYDNTKCLIITRGTNKGSIRYQGTSYLTKKDLIGVTYYLTLCKNCMIANHPDFVHKNHSKIFNTLNKFVAVAFNINPALISDTNKERVPTYVNFINKYGKKLGTVKWNEYRNKQAITNSFEYKQEKYGWDICEFNAFNKSRGITLQNLIAKHGTDTGTKKYESYINKQRITKSKEYVVSKYGLRRWDELCNSKANTLANFMKRHGEDLGLELYKKYVKRSNESISYASKVANDFFDNLIESDITLYDGLTLYYDSNDLGEFGLYCKSNEKYYFLDFYIKELNIAIEFNGDFFHANPLKYKSNEKLFWFSDIPAADVWSRDAEKLLAIEKSHGVNIITIWESEYKENPAETINNINNIIKNKKILI
jgi:very-short-patch-repair endonuclease